MYKEVRSLLSSSAGKTNALKDDGKITYLFMFFCCYGALHLSNILFYLLQFRAVLPSNVNASADKSVHESANESANESSDESTDESGDELTRRRARGTTAEYREKIINSDSPEVDCPVEGCSHVGFKAHLLKWRERVAAENQNSDAPNKPLPDFPRNRRGNIQWNKPKKWSFKSSGYRYHDFYRCLAKHFSTEMDSGTTERKQKHQEMCPLILKRNAEIALNMPKNALHPENSKSVYKGIWTGLGLEPK
jgi:hypothetical protein